MGGCGDTAGREVVGAAVGSCGASSPRRRRCGTPGRNDVGSASISERAASHSSGEGSGSGTGLGRTGGGATGPAVVGMALGRGPPDGGAMGNAAVGGAGWAAPWWASCPAPTPAVADHSGVPSARVSGAGTDADHRSSRDEDQRPTSAADGVKAGGGVAAGPRAAVAGAVRGCLGAGTGIRR